jgi:hypothetical protein
MFTVTDGHTNEETMIMRATEQRVVEAKRNASEFEIEIVGVTHNGTMPALDNRVVVSHATRLHRWAVVRSAGLWCVPRPGEVEFRVIPDSVTFHRLHRSEAAAHAEASSLQGGRVIEIN